MVSSASFGICDYYLPSRIQGTKPRHKVLRIGTSQDRRENTISRIERIGFFGKISGICQY
jgi:hypothetical protein